MAWQYSSALRDGDRVTVRFKEPTLTETKQMLLVKQNETEQEFVTRGQGIIRQWVDGLNAEQDRQTDVTNTFRPPQGGPGG